MAFVIRNLSVLAYAHGFTLWHYKTDQPLDSVASAHFFDPASEMFASGDMMLISAPDGGRMLCLTRSDGGFATVPMS
jgi:hypothetical protein